MSFEINNERMVLVAKLAHARGLVESAKDETQRTAAVARVDQAEAALAEFDHNAGKSALAEA